MRKRFKLLGITPLAVFLTIVTLLAVGLGGEPTKIPSPLIGKAVPAFTLPNLHGKGMISSAQLMGAPYAINVWASWCVTCQVEMPFLLQMQRDGVLLIGIDYKDDANNAVAWLEKFGNPFAFNAIDATGSLGLNLGVYAVPETFIVNAQGKIVFKHIGAIDDEDALATFMFAWQALQSR